MEELYQLDTRQLHLSDIQKQLQTPKLYARRHISISFWWKLATNKANFKCEPITQQTSATKNQKNSVHGKKFKKKLDIVKTTKETLGKIISKDFLCIIF